MVKIKLRSCPFCGEQPKLKTACADDEPFCPEFTFYSVQCDCGCGTAWDNKKNVVVDMWNRRDDDG